jgi:hypothetical protein
MVHLIPLLNDTVSLLITVNVKASFLHLLITTLLFYIIKNVKLKTCQSFGYHFNTLLNGAVYSVSTIKDRLEVCYFQWSHLYEVSVCFLTLGCNINVFISFI